MGDFQKLIVWREARRLVVEVYRISAVFPTSERFGLTQQLRRSAVSVSSNIAEGSGRGAPRTFRAFVRIARGSLHELRSQICLAVDLEFTTPDTAATALEIADELGRMLSGILRSDSK